jgi:hypothetical protein
MALTILSTGNVLDRGTVANDNTGDTLRTAAQKINTNFETLDSAVTNQTWANASVTNSILRYDGTKFVATDGLLVDTNGNITISGTLSSDSATITGDIAVSGLVDGRDIAADGITLDSATASNTPHAIVARDGSGNFLAGTITASLSGTATNATNATNVDITNDTSTNSTHYVHFGVATSGNDGVKVSDTNLTFNPSTGVLQVGGHTVATTNTALLDAELTNIAAIKGINQALTTTSDVTFNTVTDNQANVRELAVTAITGTPSTISSGSSGKYFSLRTGASVVNINAANFSAGDIVTIADTTGSQKTITFGTWSSGVRVAGVDSDYSGVSVTLAEYGVCTIIADTSDRAIVTGNVS